MCVSSRVAASKGIRRPRRYHAQRPLLLVCGCVPALAQNVSNQPAVSSAKNLRQLPRVPGISSRVSELNAGITVVAVHDSYIGWYSLVTPAVSYTFSPHYSADATVSIYPYRLTLDPNASSSSTQQLVPTHGDLGDTLVSFRARFDSSSLQHVATASMTVPTGNRANGLGTGRVTFDFDEHIEHYRMNLGTILDIGLGDSSGLFNQAVAKDYSSVGPLAHFQTGFVYWLPGHSYIQSVAYEQLPLGDQKLYTTYSFPGRRDVTGVSGRNITEDNGFTTSVGIPLSSHVMLSSYYNRSLRLHLDTVSLGLTFVLRELPGKHKLSMADKAILEAEGAK